MIKEDYISFETAKLLKEKGFSEATIGLYDCGNERMSFMVDINWNDKNDCPFISAPTLQMAMKWLRQVHHIFIQVELYSKYDDYCFEVFQNTHRLILEKHETYNNYEEACEAAIKYVLENLI